MPLLIAGTQSGCGKSTVTLGVLAALRARGLRVQPFKSGPDFIDPGLHTMVTGRVSRNLDIWMCGGEYCRNAIRRASAGADVAVAEGVMGYYDGGDRSTAALARAIGADTVLVIDAYGMAESAGAIIKGFAEYGGPLNGVIFNRVGSERHYERLRAASSGVEVLGYLPREVEFMIPERHLGLMVAEERPLADDAVAALGRAAERYINISRIAELGAVGDIAIEPEPVEPVAVRIAIARDRAFCFYYEDNLDMLREAGAELMPFSPLKDSALPVGIDAVYIGGGYPEEYARELEANAPMRQSIREWADNGGPVYAECGGLMYLGAGITRQGTRHEMSDVFPIETAMRNRRSALGYREITLSANCILGAAGGVLRGHEFHYSEIIEAPAAGGVRYNVLGEADGAVTSVIKGRALGSYIHLHFGSRPGAAGAMTRSIREWKR